MFLKPLPALLSLAAIIATGCVTEPEPDPSTSKATSAFSEGGCTPIDVVGYPYDGALVSAGGCVGTLFRRDWILGSAKCTPTAGSPVFRYDNSMFLSNPTGQTIKNVYMRPGVAPQNDDYTDTSGNYADLALIQISAPLVEPASGFARLAYATPPNGTSGDEVGRVESESCNAILPFSYFGQTTSQVYSTGAGSFLLYARNAPGDASPFYVSRRVAGVYTGYVFDSFELHDKFTAVAPHLPWILKTIGWVPPYNSVRSGTMIGTAPFKTLLTPSEAVCAYACSTTESCLSWDHQGGLNACNLHREAGPVISGLPTSVRSGTNVKIVLAL